MAEKYLPIQFFEKRKDYDDRVTEGGGSDRLPSWVLSGDALSERAETLNGCVRTLSDAFYKRKRSSSALPLVVCTQIEENAIAKSHRSGITSMFATIDGDNVIGFLGDRCLLTKVTDESVIGHIEKTLADTKSQAKVISSIVDMAPFYGLIDAYDSDIPCYQVRLVDYDDYDLNSIVTYQFEQWCKEKNITIAHKTKYTPSMTIYRVRLDSADEMDMLGEFEGIYSIERTMPVSATLDALSQDAALQPKAPVEDGDYPVVGVLDSGISPNQYLEDWVADTFTSYPEKYVKRDHGTFVSGIIEYGDELNDSSYTMLSGVRLLDATIYPDDNKIRVYPDDLIDNIREAVERYRDIKVWNLSAGTTEEASLSEFSEFGMALDNIQDENDVLIVKSAGNCTNFMINRPKSRISKSADSVRALVVGSIAHEKGPYDYADVDMPSPFTRVGPGPSSITKPDLVFYGGNAGMKGKTPSITGVPSFSVDGAIYKNAGTSFSTPWVTRMAAELSFIINEEFDPLLIRALMIHNAKYPKSCDMVMSDKVKQMGFGVPTSVSEMLYNSSDEITLILRDTLEKGSFLQMFDFPYPSCLIDENGFFSGQIIVTLVTKSLLDDKQAGEYCQSDMSILFGTYSTEVDRDTTKRTVFNPMGLDEPQNVLLDDLYSSRVKGKYPHNGFERECFLVKYGRKFHPVKKYAIDLSDMTHSNREKYLSGDRKWYLELKGLYRDFIEHDAVVRNYQLSQEFCLLLTIRDPKGTRPVYDEVSQQLENRNFIHHNIHLRNIVTLTTDDN